MTCNSKISLYSREWCRQWPGWAGPLCTLVRAPLVPKYLVLCQHTDTAGHTDALRTQERQRVRQHKQWSGESRRSGLSDTGSMAETSTLATLAIGDAGAVEGPGSSLHWTDYLVIVGYFLAVIVVSRLNIVRRNLQSIFYVLRLGLCHHSRVKETRWTGIFWQAGAWIGSR